MVADPLISIIIPCYNHSKYLNQAIQSSVDQSYPSIEIIVVDDGSSEDIKKVTDQYSRVTYIRQCNQGLSSARNTGIHNCSGEYLLFLDADDWLYPKAVELNMKYLIQNPDAAFVSGALDYYDEKSRKFFSVKKRITSDHYRHLLFNNYIDVPASVLYRRWIFNEFQFNTVNNEAGDYDIYLRISRKYKVIHHNDKIAVYRQHDTNMSGSYLKMLQKCLEALNDQKKSLQGIMDATAYKAGRKNWKIFYGRYIISKTIENPIKQHWYPLYVFTKKFPLISCYHLRRYWKRLLFKKTRSLLKR